MTFAITPFPPSRRAYIHTSPTMPMGVTTFASEDIDIFRSSFVSALAMSFSALFFAVSSPTYSAVWSARELYLRKNFFWRQPRVIAPPNRDIVYSSALGPLGQCQCLTVVRYALVAKSVIGLLFVRCPPAIRRFVISIIVDPVQRCTFWARSHIRIKLHKIVPFRHDLNPPAAIAVIMGSPKIITATAHQTPSGMFFSMRKAMLLTHKTLYQENKEQVK